MTELEELTAAIEKLADEISTLNTLITSMRDDVNRRCGK